MKKTFIAVICLTIIFWTIPYIWGFLIGGSEQVFGGFLINIADGNSYLAKMQIGWRGEWKFTLPYTAEPGDGAYLFLFYIILGHMSRIIGFPIPLMFHLARLLAGILMVWSLWKFCQWIFGEHWIEGASFFPLIALGSGLGWIASPIIGMTSDLWVAEAYPALSGFVNPHFPLGISLILWILMQAFSTTSFCSKVRITILGLLLSIIMPFGVVVIGVVLVGTVIWEWFISKKLRLDALIFPLGLGGVFLIYQFAVIQSDPVLQLWNAQNITASPPIWDFIISFSPALLLAVYGLWVKKKLKSGLPWRIIFLWLVLGFLMVYFPFSLQRRFLTAYFVPVSLLGITGLIEITRKVKFRILIPIILIASFLTNVLLWSGTCLGVLSKNSNLFLSSAEQEAMNWLDNRIEKGSLVAASPFMGMIIPTRTSMRVIYGHPFETAHANDELNFINTIFAGQRDPALDIKELKDRNVKFVFWGEREKAIGKPTFIETLPVVFDNSQVQIFEIMP